MHLSGYIFDFFLIITVIFNLLFIQSITEEFEFKIITVCVFQLLITEIICVSMVFENNFGHYFVL